MLPVSCTNDQKDNYTDFPIHPEAINPQHFSDRIAKGVTSLTYKVETPFPASELIKFIEDSMTGKGFTRYVMELHQPPAFIWTDFNSQTGKWEEASSIPARYFTSWANETENEVIWIVIDYASVYKTEDWEKTAHVMMQSASLSQFKEEMETLKKLTYNH